MKYLLIVVLVLAIYSSGYFLSHKHLKEENNILKAEVETWKTISANSKQHENIHWIEIADMDSTITIFAQYFNFGDIVVTEYGHDYIIESIRLATAEEIIHKGQRLGVVISDDNIIFSRRKF
jgi:hypothetical protein